MDTCHEPFLTATAADKPAMQGCQIEDSVSDKENGQINRKSLPDPALFRGPRSTKKIVVDSDSEVDDDTQLINSREEIWPSTEAAPSAMSRDTALQAHDSDASVAPLAGEAPNDVLPKKKRLVSGMRRKEGVTGDCGDESCMPTKQSKPSELNVGGQSDFLKHADTLSKLATTRPRHEIQPGFGKESDESEHNVSEKSSEHGSDSDATDNSNEQMSDHSPKVPEWQGKRRESNSEFSKDLSKLQKKSCKPSKSRKSISQAAGPKGGNTKELKAIAALSRDTVISDSDEAHMEESSTTCSDADEDLISTERGPLQTASFKATNLKRSKKKELPKTSGSSASNSSDDDLEGLFDDDDSDDEESGVESKGAEKAADDNEVLLNTCKKKGKELKKRKAKTKVRRAPSFFFSF
jgi:hypothetical protein